MTIVFAIIALCAAGWLVALALTLVVRVLIVLVRALNYACG